MGGVTKEQVFSALLTAAIFIVAYFVVTNVFKRLAKRTNNAQRENVYKALSKILGWAIIIIGIINTVSVFPTLKGIFTSLLAGSGVAALVLSIASQDAISNFVSGLIIMFSKPYKVGDLIKYVDTGTLGYVTEIKIRHTVIKTLENTQLIVPNSIINNTAIENYSYNDDRRVYQPLAVDITYESDYNKALVLMTAVIQKNPNFIDVRSEKEKENGKPPVVVRFRKFGDSSLTMEAWVWAKNYVTWLNMRSELNQAIKKAFDENGIDFAYPHVQVVK